MKSITTGLAALACAIAFTAPALAEIYSPAGIWTTGSKDSRYEITLCGDGDDMCARVVWVKDHNLAHLLDSVVLDTVKRVKTQVWRGVAVLDGNRFRGTLTLVDRDTLHIRACNGAACGEIELYRE